MSLIKLNKKKSSLSTSSASSNSSGECYYAPHTNSFAKFDEKKDYFKRCNKKCEKKCPSSVSFCLSR
ncbi:hypothetical protein CANTEDRAFT_114276 [Yamadazyma tenuis ATCC 10573]|uniref:Uncharacterized protein n=1 Tax=Candida tenuis (strain ATCC 10573 / BCRC 21748 / CBS 615 / JCM 9827 / NBRC 10315 / NRRL Y-1498 / VKM Y-70) TaxID=590646 RepID=G3B3Q3_CANTC|nr:uncharacterized protein CANTEDRAFT_114276 [Yamadazyma tenuis ATCC 10573]EGV64210.1 hypothetical protein CANTEDRAFT_114276 [Yamadazyma tenuis ATCC 10573]